MKNQKWKEIFPLSCNNSSLEARRENVILTLDHSGGDMCLVLNYVTGMIRHCEIYEFMRRGIKKDTNDVKIMP